MTLLRPRNAMEGTQTGRNGPTNVIPRVVLKDCEIIKVSMLGVAFAQAFPKK